MSDEHGEDLGRRRAGHPTAARLEVAQHPSRALLHELRRNAGKWSGAAFRDSNGHKRRPSPIACALTAIGFGRPRPMIRSRHPQKAQRA